MILYVDRYCRDALPVFFYALVGLYFCSTLLLNFMADITSRATVELVINGKSANDTLKNLKDKAADLKKKMDECVLKNDLKGAQSYQRQLERTEKEISKITSLGNNFSKTLNNLDRASLKNLQDTLKQLQRQIKGIERGTEEWNRHAEAIRRVRSQLNQANSALRTVDSTTQSFASRTLAFFNKWQMAIMGTAASLTGLIVAGRNAVKQYAAIEQEMANVRKYTGLEAEDVEKLNEDFKKINTRSSREELNKLAQEAGRLGKTAPNDILGFVRAADKVNVALDDLGEGATLTLSKLTGIFGDEKRLGTEKALLSVGSVINELSQNCSASAPYLAEFASRLGGVGAQAGLTVQQIMGYAAVLDSNNQKLEASATALSQVMVRIYQDPSKYAKVAGMDVKNFANLVRTDMNSALIEFLSTLKKAGNMDVLSPMFKDMGENGSRAISALSTLANHIDDVKSQQYEANKAFAEATSIDKEFNVQNNTVQAGIDKAKKRITELSIELGEKLMPVMKHVYSSSSVMLRVLSASINFIFENKRELLLLTSAIIAYTVATNAAAVSTRAISLATKTWAAINKAIPATLALFKVGVAAATNGVQYFTNGLRVNYAMQLRWKNAINLLMTAGPAKVFVVATAAAVALTKVIMSLISRYQVMTGVIKTMNEIRAQAIEKVEDERQKIHYLMEAANDLNKSEEERIRICNKLNSIIPGMSATIDVMTNSFVYATKAVDNHIKSLTRLYEIQGAKEKLKDLGKERAELTIKQSELNSELDEIKVTRQLNNQIYSGNSGVTTQGGYFPAMVNTSISQAGQESGVKRELYKINNKLKENEAKTKTIYNTYGVMELTSDDSSDSKNEPSTPSGGSYTSSKQAEKEAKKAAAAARRAAVKARKEFREELNSAKGVWEAGDAENIAQYSQGLKSWTEFLEEKHRLQEKFYDDQLKIFQKHNLQEDEDYQELLKKKEQLNADWLSRKAAMSVEDARNNQKAEEMQAQFDFDSPENPMFRNQEALQLRLHDIKVKYLEKMRDAYSKDSKEYHDYSLQLTETEEQEKLRIRKKFADAYVKYSREYQLKSAKEQYDIQIALLNEMLEKEVISLQEFKAAVDRLKKEIADNSIPESARNRVSEGDLDAKSRIRDLEDLQAAFTAGLITETEYLKSRDNIEEFYQKKAIDRARSTGNEYSSMLLNLYEAFKALGEGGDGNIWLKIGAAAEASFAVMGAAMSAYSEFAKAESDAMIARAERRYEAEASLAEGNVYKQKQAEKKKQKEIAKIKGDANRKQFTMQILQAIAQTATNALNAYGAMVGIPVVGPTLAAIAAAMAAAAGAVQIATIRKQKQASEAAGYMQGGFTPKGRKDEPVGVVHAGEWVAPQEIVNSPQTRPIINLLEHARRNNRVASIRQADISMAAMPVMSRQSQRNQVPVQNVPAPEQDNSELKETISRLNERLDEPFVTVNSVTGQYGIKRAWDEYDRLIRNKSRKKRRS